MTPEEQTNMVEECASKLGEYFDNVQIMVSWNVQGRTKSKKARVGDWYACQGLAHELISEAVNKDLAIEIADKIKDKPDGSDDWKAVNDP